MPLLPGFLNLQDLLKERVIKQDFETINTAFEQSLAFHNEVTSQSLALFSQNTEAYQIRYKSPVAAFLEALDEHGRARPVKMAGHYDVAFPVYKAGRAFGMTRDARVKMTVQEANDQLSLMLDADRRWVRRMLLSALFTNVDRTFLDEEFGSLVVKPLANGDSQEYLIQEGADAGAIAQHYAAQAGAIATGVSTNPFPVIYLALSQKAENSGEGEVVSFFHSNQTAAVKAVGGFIEETDPDIALGANSSRLIGSLNATVPGRVIGKLDRVWMVEWNAIPDNYIVSVITSGPRALALREPGVEELKGFKAVSDREDHPYFERQFERRLGFGGFNRVGAHVYRVGNASYAIPSGFDASVLI